MSSTVIKVENLSKQYRLGEVSTGSVAHDINRLWYKIRGKEDPYLKIGESNDRTIKGITDYVWALKEINFEVHKGEILGIIGRNGAGKSTLLKILSRTTIPTIGTVKIKGRIASLLEVGTGFHPELSGRDNIYLNGAILGMTKKEITKKFDEIVDFAGVERYIDTPVKRYSSGMYVRLAFGVAAHLEPEILIVDEVLAVGDAEFQKKCLGKMQDVSNKDGRTVIFVSHNMTAVKNLCNSVIFMNQGSISAQGPTDSIINTYLSNYVNNSLLQSFESLEEAPGNEKVRLKKIQVVPQLNNPLDPITISTSLNIEFEFWNFEDNKLLNLSLFVNTLGDECVFATATEGYWLEKGVQKAICKIPGNLLNDNIYSISVMIVGNSSAIHFFQNIVSFEINENRRNEGWQGKWPGVIRPKLEFDFIK